MTVSAALIVAGYVALIWQFGLWGFVAVAGHLATLLACVPRR